MVFQDALTALNPTMRIGKQIAENITNHQKAGKDEVKKRVLEMLRLVGIADAKGCVKKYPHELSGGMRQRVMIATALAGNPEILIADEPTTALDVTVQSQIVKLLKRINQKKGTAILFISHDLSLVRRLCSRVIVMKDGRIVEQGAMEDIFENPQQEYTQKLIAAIPGCVKKNSGRSAKTEEAHG